MGYREGNYLAKPFFKDTMVNSSSEIGLILLDRNGAKKEYSGKQSKLLRIVRWQ